MSEAQKKAPEAQVISDVKEKIAEVVPTPTEAIPISSPQALKERLNWGEPALTIIDARTREAYLEERIVGAMLMSDVASLAKNRDIYVYGNNDKDSSEAADRLRQDGFQTVSQIRGGLSGWKAISGKIEGRTA